MAVEYIESGIVYTDGQVPVLEFFEPYEGTGRHGYEFWDDPKTKDRYIKDDKGRVTVHEEVTGLPFEMENVYTQS